jgi:hypothetical protein
MFISMCMMASIRRRLLKAYVVAVGTWYPWIYFYPHIFVSTCIGMSNCWTRMTSVVSKKKIMIHSSLFQKCCGFPKHLEMKFPINNCSLLTPLRSDGRDSVCLCTCRKLNVFFLWIRSYQRWGVVGAKGPVGTAVVGRLTPKARLMRM